MSKRQQAALRIRNAASVVSKRQSVTEGMGAKILPDEMVAELDFNRSMVLLS